MKTPVTATLAAFAFLLFVLAFAFTNEFQGWQNATIGSLDVPLNQQGEIRSLINRTDSAGAGNYDSLDLPRGTTFTVPTGQRLIITRLCAVDLSGPSGTHVEIGYGDTAVADSATPPTNSVTLYTTFCGTDGTEGRPIWAEIPAGKIPWARSHSTGAWEASATGVLRDD